MGIATKRQVGRASARKKAARTIPAARRKASKKKATSPKRRDDAKPQARRKFEGASKSKRLSGWKTSSTSANSETAQGLSVLRDRSHDLRRNNPYAAKGIQTITSNVVGTGIVTQFRDGNAGTLEANWAEWAETTSIDFDGRHNIYGLQALVMDAVAESGEVLLRRRILAGLKYPIQYQVLEPDFLDVTKTDADLPGGGFIVQGIEFSKEGKRVAYWLYETHPGGIDASFFKRDLDSNRIPAEEVRHIYRMDRPGQARGVPWLAPVIVRLKDFDDMEDAQLVRQKIAACFAAFVTDISHEFYPEDDDADILESEDEHGELEDLPSRVSPGSVEILPKGKTVVFADPPSTENYPEYASTVLHAIAAGLGITYESLTGDYSQVNFSSGRMGRLEMMRNIRSWQERIVHVHMLDPIVADFKMMCEIQGDDVTGVKYTHVNPPVEMIDPTKELPMLIEEIRSGIGNLSDTLLARGKDPKRHLEQYKKDLDLLDSLGIKLTSDPRVELSSKGKNKVTGEIGKEETNGKKKNSAKARSTPSIVRPFNVQRRKTNNGRGLDNRRAG